MANLEVLDHGAPIAFSFDDLLKYHGFGYPGGVAHAFKVMERAFPLLSPGNPPERHGISIETAFPGPGGRDAFEMVTRAVTGGRYRVDDAFAPAGTLASPKDCPCALGGLWDGFSRSVPGETRTERACTTPGRQLIGARYERQGVLLRLAQAAGLADPPDEAAVHAVMTSRPI